MNKNIGLFRSPKLSKNLSLFKGGPFKAGDIAKVLHCLMQLEMHIFDRQLLFHGLYMYERSISYRIRNSC